MLRQFIHIYENTEKHLKLQVRRRASNESTEAAASGIASFLELDGNEETSQGWMLISTLNLLAAAGENLVEVINVIRIILEVNFLPRIKPLLNIFYLKSFNLLI